MKVSIIIPVYNEEATILPLLTKVKNSKLPKGFTKEIIIVNDNSSDKTVAKIKSVSGAYKLINHKVNRGKGAAVRTGIRNSSGEVILVQDADLEYNPADYIKLLTPFMNPETKAVYGSRLINYPLQLFGKNKTLLPLHWLANHMLTALTNILFASHITDMETCYKAIRTSVAKDLELTSNRFDIEPEITAKLLKRNITIHEVPILVTPRTYEEGKKIGWHDGVIAAWTLFRYRFS